MKAIQTSLLSVFMLAASLPVEAQNSIPQRTANKAITGKGGNTGKNHSGKYFQEGAFMNTGSNKSLRSNRTITPETVYVDGKTNLR